MNFIKMLIISLMFTGCSSAIKMSEPNIANYQKTSSEIGAGKSLWVSEVKSASVNKDKLEKTFGYSLEGIAQTEFNNNGFSVLERRNFDLVANENSFSNNVASANKLHNFVKASDYTAVINIVNITLEDSGIGIPLILFIKDYTVSVSLELQLIDNRTGAVTSYNGLFSAKKDYFNALIFLGSIDLNLNNLVEYSYRSAIDNAIKKVKI